MSGRSATVGAVMVVLASSLAACRAELPVRTVEDASFTRVANATCARTLPGLRQARPEPGRGSREPEVLAEEVEVAAGRLEELADDLRRIPVAAEDQADVDAWLDDWDAYVTVGRRFATTLRESGEKAAASVSTEDDELARRISQFAQANAMPQCAL